MLSQVRLLALAALLIAVGCKKKEAEGEPTAEVPVAPEAPATAEDTSAPPPAPSAPAEPPKEEASAEVSVPDFKGKTLVEVVKAATDAGLLVRIAEAREQKGAVPGTVLSQAPAAGQKVERLSVVEIIPADAPAPPPPLFDVPSVKGQPIAQARLTLFEKGFTPRVGPPQFTGGAPGRVVNQIPEARSKAAKGSVVTIVPEKAVILVPELRQQPVVDAILRLRKADLDWSGREQVTREVPAGTVIDQDPKPGANVDHDKEIRLTVAKAPPGDSKPPQWCRDLDDVQRLRRQDLDEVTRLLGKVLPKNYVSAIELDPASPAQRGSGEHVQVSFRYATEFGKDALIYVIPRAGGKDVAGASRLQFRCRPDGQDTFKGSFTAYALPGPVLIDELYVVMFRMSKGFWGQKLVEVRLPVKIRFQPR